jgi:hypothetical protein
MGFYNSENRTFNVRYELRLLMQSMLFLAFKRLNSNIFGPSGRACGCLSPVIVGSNPTGAWMSVFCECCVLSGRGLCVDLITRPEESYRLWCVVVCDVKPRE